MEERFMKRIITLLLIIGMLVSLVACGNKNDMSNNEINLDGDSTTELTSSNVENSSETTLSIDSVKKAKETDASLFEYIDVANGVSITGFSGDCEIVVIPNNIEGKNVVSIGKNAFINNNTMKGVKIPETAQVLGESSFLNCTELEVAVFGSSVKKIDMYAFGGCKKLHDIEFNDGLESLGFSCLGFTNFTSIEIPSSITEINDPFVVDGSNRSITVIAESGSSAEQYVKEKGEAYHLIFQAK